MMVLLGFQERYMTVMMVVSSRMVAHNIQMPQLVTQTK